MSTRVWEDRMSTHVWEGQNEEYSRRSTPV